MAFCLPADLSEKFKTALKDGTIDPAKLADMSSADRRAFFERIVGSNAQEVNAQFESKLLLKDYKRGLVSWAKKISGISDPVRRDLIARIEKMTELLTPADEKSFLSDLATHKLGAAVSAAEARLIAERSENVTQLRSKWDKQAAAKAHAGNPLDKNAGWPDENTRLEYGYAKEDFHSFINDLKGNNAHLTFREALKTPIRSLAGATKGILAAFDNSYFGRQGLKQLFVNPDIWARAFVSSWSDAGKQLMGTDAMRAIRADILSRPNAMNGKYAAGKYALGVDFEEAFPSALPERLPVLGRIYKASEAAFNGAALRMRADYADKIINLAEKSGVNTLDAAQAKGLGSLVNAMTGRGNLPQVGPEVADAINTTFFSIRFLKGNIDTLTLHQFGRGLEGAAKSFVVKQSATNLLRIVGGIAAILYTADQLAPGSVTFDPRNADFGKIRAGSTRIDVTGGMGALVTLAARLIPTEHNGKWGLWYQSSTSHAWTQLNNAKYGQQTAIDVFNSFFEGKLSPLAGVVRDAWKGKMFGNKPATPGNLAAGLITPLPLQTFQDLMSNPDAAPVILGMLADGLGFSTNTY